MTDILSILSQQQSRRIGLIVPSVVISEKHDNSPEITEHPVEVGVTVSDHTFRRPPEVVMQVGFAGGGSLPDLVDTPSLGLSASIGPREAYQELLSLQSSRVPLDVMTGKRTCTNMLICVLEVTTDRTSENILSAVPTLREVVITSTTATHVAPKSNMKSGANTSVVQNSGVKTPVQKNEPILSRPSGFVVEG